MELGADRHSELCRVRCNSEEEREKKDVFIKDKVKNVKH